VATTFGGIWQPVRLRAYAVGFQDVQVDADIDSGAVRLRGRVVDLASGTRSLRAGQRSPVVITHYQCRREPRPDGKFDVAVPVPNAGLWSPETPILYTARFDGPRRRSDGCMSMRFGFRRLAADGEQLLLNGAPVCLRGR